MVPVFSTCRFDMSISRCFICIFRIFLLGIFGLLNLPKESKSDRNRFNSQKLLLNGVSPNEWPHPKYSPYAKSREFYTKTTFWYRLWYMIPVFISFRMRIYVGLVLSEAACTIVGLGAYPKITEPKPGKGPSVNFDLLRNLKDDPIAKRNTEFNFETVHNINIWYTETDPSVRSSIRYWNMCVQYWMANIVYKRFPIKFLRTAATFVVSALWHGIYAGYYLCLCSVPFYLPVEDIWDNLLRLNATGTKRKILDVVFWIVRTQAFSYMGMAFSLLSMKSGLRYYESVYYVYHVTYVIALVSGLLLTEFIKRGEKVEDEEKKYN